MLGCIVILLRSLGLTKGLKLAILSIRVDIRCACTINCRLVIPSRMVKYCLQWNTLWKFLSRIRLHGHYRCLVIKLEMTWLVANPIAIHLENQIGVLEWIRFDWFKANWPSCIVRNCVYIWILLGNCEPLRSWTQIRLVLWLFYRVPSYLFSGELRKQFVFGNSPVQFLIRVDIRSAWRPNQSSTLLNWINYWLLLYLWWRHHL